MARILIAEPHADVRALLEIVVARLGHEPVRYDGLAPDLREVDAAVIEPGEGIGLELSRRLRGRDVPVVVASIFPPSAELLALEPVAYLIKPFPLYALERALASALEPAAARI